TGFVHTAPSHGREDFDAWMDAVAELIKRGVDTSIPFPVDDAGFFTKDAPGFGPDREGGPARVIDDNGKKGNANQAVIEELIKRNALFARGRLKHSYPHSWRSKKPVIFRNTPQWFVYMDKDLGDGTTLRSRALQAIDDTRFVPAAGQNRIRAMIEERPDWVLSRQRAWGVPIAVFADADGNVLKDEAVNQRI
ncbi:MAG: isoleucine--tRNA ligase, partial [Mesorhizobium sp.]